MDFLARDVTEAVAVCVEADGGVEIGFAAGPAKANMASRVGT